MRGVAITTLCALGPACFVQPNPPTSGGAPVRWASSFVTNMSPNVPDTFSAQAKAVGDAVVIELYCGGLLAPPTLSVSAPGWSFTQIGGITGKAGFWAASTVAVAPDKSPAMFNVEAPTDCGNSGIIALGDEFTDNNPSGGSTTFPAHDETFGYGDCATTLTVPDTGDAIWAGCMVDGAIPAPGVGYSDASKVNGDRSEYMIATSPGAQLVTFPHPGGLVFAITAVAIRQR